MGGSAGGLERAAGAITRPAETRFSYALDPEVAGSLAGASEGPETLSVEVAPDQRFAGFDRDGMARLVGRVIELDGRWARCGVPELTGWWQRALWRMAARRRAVWRVGRRGGKSQTLCKLAVVCCIHGEHVVPSTDIGTVIVVSYERSDAADRIKTCAELLKLLGWNRTDKGLPKMAREYNVTADGITLMREDGAMRRILVVTCSVRSARSKTAIALLFDEVAFWRDDDDVNPASDILASARPCMAGQPLAFEIMSSTPWSSEDEHGKAFDEGETDEQTVHEAPTWVARPTLTEAETHTLEKDIVKWECEYACIPRPSYATSYFDPEAIERACA